MLIQNATKAVAHNTDNFFVHTPSSVEFGTDHGTKYALLDGTWKHQFDRRSSIGAQLDLGVNEKHLKDQFLNGKFFIVDDHIVDHRLKDDLTRSQFIHSDDSIKALVEHLGFSKSVPKTNIIAVNELGGVGKPMARSQTEVFECNATNSLGGQFDITIGFSWSPFSVDIHSFIEMWREVCSNGAVARAPMMNHRIPMLNSWKDNLEISNQVIRHNFDQIVLPRLQALPNERISMNDLTVLMRIVDDQLSSKQLEHSSIKHLTTIRDKLDSAWDGDADRLKKNILKFIPAPVSAYDAMNIATEVGTHHVGRDRTSGQAQSFVNKLIFDQSRTRNLNVDLDSLAIDHETFNQVDQAFFGITAH